MSRTTSYAVAAVSLMAGMALGSAYDRFRDRNRDARGRHDLEISHVEIIQPGDGDAAFRRTVLSTSPLHPGDSIENGVWGITIRRHDGPAIELCGEPHR